ncbi:MAG: RidA family protein [Alphaproteobacteria bacterium]|nr:RidA family protein [Alphaproteobacteria bacterium]
MAGCIEQRLKDLGISLPVAATPIANYVPAVRTGNLVFIAGQLPLKDGQVAVEGKLGESVSLEQGIQAARLCAFNILAQAKGAVGDLDNVVRIVKLTGFVACTPSFTQHPQIVNGASDVMVDVFGDIGSHARAAVGAPSLPRNAAVEVEAVIEIA